MGPPRVSNAGVIPGRGGGGSSLVKAQQISLSLLCSAQDWVSVPVLLDEGSLQTSLKVSWREPGSRSWMLLVKKEA